MKNSNVILALSLLLLAVANVSALSQVPASDEGSIVLAIAAKSNFVKVGDNIVVGISMENMHKESYCYHEVIETRKAELNGYDIEVIGSDARQLPVTKPAMPRGWSMGNRCVEPEKTASDEMIVNRLVDVSNPGVYHIRVSHRDKMTNGMVWSNSITVTIAP